MSEFSNVSGLGGNQAINNVDVSKIFLRDNRYQEKNQINNSTYNPLNLVAGTAMARLTSSGNLVPLDTAAATGAQFFVGLLAQDMSLDSGETQLTTIVDFGDVAEDKVVFFYANQGLETVVASRRMRDNIQAQGIKLVPAIEMTAYDNQ